MRYSHFCEADLQDRQSVADAMQAPNGRVYIGSVSSPMKARQSDLCIAPIMRKKDIALVRYLEEHRQPSNECDMM